MIVNRDCVCYLYLLFDAVHRSIDEVGFEILRSETRIAVVLELAYTCPCHHEGTAVLLLVRRFETSRLCYNKITGS